MAVTREQAYAELYKRGKLNEDQRKMVEELARRGKIDLSAGVTNGEVEAVTQEAREELEPKSNIAKLAEIRRSNIEEMDEDINDMGAMQTFFTAMGKGLYDVGAGVGLLEPLDEATKKEFSKLEEKRQAGKNWRR